MSVARGPGGETMSAAEFQRLTELGLEFLSEHPDAGPKLAALGFVSRFVFPDLKLVLDVGPADRRKRKSGRHLAWAWGGAWRGPKPAVLVSVPAALANRSAQGKEKAAAFVARDEVVVTPLAPEFDRAAVLDLVPILSPLDREWVARMRAEGFGRFLR